MRFKAVTHKGKVRKSNEDNYFVDKESSFFLVADGMGGHAAGEVASKIAVEKSSDFNLPKKNNNILVNLKKLINNVNEQIIEESQRNSEYLGMGTTYSAALIREGRLYYAHVGDSRIYIFRKGKLKQVNKEHSLVADLIRNGKLEKKEAFNHPQKHILTQALGLEKELEIDAGKEDISTGDIILLCTDGLSDLIREEEIEDLINVFNRDLDLLAENLLNTALKNGGSDNITFILILNS
ncbi:MULTISPECIES: Stp1/IreP family PP2C-type Ser/Thr phosphatase [unclassified Halanaerobium]|uniref:Stp1/IreP family PP2C-type Ser/Thr phosphatase n=1 Tax=unclassified Halanaerobium TaxID=2641197 RepID=UPI000DF3B74B|nr:MULTISPECIES: Stp1/IreP family PP2C-type Ser/Thr phosphatase [unclassified Halanaerobium]RCW51417.1 protein phosphatase [Halanaerobium sp. MA284_MarDTE_T2]RCW89206.1 protein phosphatase [Halanaerobium sp. DL-01]